MQPLISHENYCLPKERIAHMHGVAELMYKYYDKFDCKYLTHTQIYMLGLNHDIGYVISKSGHEAFGAELFPFRSTMYECMYWHGTAPQEYMQIKECCKEDIPDELILLWWADLMVESSGKNAGQIVGFQKRLENIKKRYGIDSGPYKICKDTTEWLSANLSPDLLATKEM